MRKRRLALLAILAVAVAPGTWVRSDLPEPDFNAPLVIKKLTVPKADLGEMVLDQAWQLSSEHPRFGGYSALLYMPDGSFRSGSDSGRRLDFELTTGRQDPSTMRGLGLNRFPDKRTRDLESLTRDPDTGMIWAGLEGSNSIVRFNGDMRFSNRAEPEALQSWSENAGPESLARLSDGRFVVLSEGTDETGLYPGFVFAGDPTEQEPVAKFHYRAPEDYRPVDMVQLNSRQVLILIRRVALAFPLKFQSAVVVAELNGLESEEPWRGKVVASLTDELFEENYEGMALSEDGALYLISDDNLSRLQRTLMLRLVWKNRNLNRHAKRRTGKPARPLLINNAMGLSPALD